MNLADFKRWHWVLIGLVVGLAFGGIRHYAGSDPQTYDTVVRTLNNPREFEWGLSQAVTLESGERPVITDIVVYPRIAGDDFQPVVFYQAVASRDPYDPAKPDGPRRCDLTRNLLEAKIPYVPSVDAPANVGPDYTVLDYLAHVKSKGGVGAQINYRYAWWWEPQWNFLICAAGGVVLIGGLWPTALRVLVGAGWGPKPSPKQPKDKSRSAKRGKAVATAPAGPTDADRAQLAELEAALMAKVGDFGANSPTGSVDEEEAEHAAKIKELNAAKLEPTVVAGARSDEPKHYEGAFYPVAKPVVKKKD